MIFLTFFIGLIANFIGYIPPGNINLTLVRITINRGIKQALQFITAFSCVEFFFTYFIMHAAKWLSAQVKLDVVIDWVMVVLFLVLGIITWINRKKPPETKYSEHDSIKYGILLGFINPMQVPFWIITGTYLITHEWILDGSLALVIFSAGSAGGAFLCLFLYAQFAKYIQSKFALSTRVINTAIAVLFFAFAGYHVVKRIYLAVVPKHVKENTTTINIKNNNSSLIGKWSMCQTVDMSAGTLINYNVRPTIIFSENQNGVVITPDKELSPFNWKIAKNKLIIKNKGSRKEINDGIYSIIYTNKETFRQVELIDSIRKIKYIL